MSVKSKDQIGTLVDSKNKLDGCLFLEQMGRCCGHTYRVLKVVDSIFDEQHKRTLKPRSPLYIIDGLICEGKTNEFPSQCDRSCFLLWHECWLEKTQLPFTDSRRDSLPVGEHCQVGAAMCQLKYIKEIGYRNSWPNDKLQYSIRKLRWYRKTVSHFIHDIRHAEKHRDFSLSQIQAGDLVMVRHKADIKMTLDGWRQTKGCSFAPLMYKECGK